MEWNIMIIYSDANGVTSQLRKFDNKSRAEAIVESLITQGVALHQRAANVSLTVLRLY